MQLQFAEGIIKNTQFKHCKADLSKEITLAPVVLPFA